MKKIIIAILIIFALGFIGIMFFGQIKQGKQRWGFIDKNGNPITKVEFENVHDFSGGMAGVLKDGKWGFIDSKGNIVIRPQFSQIRGFHSNQLAAARDYESGNMGYIDRNGKWTFKAVFDDLEEMNDDRAVAGILLDISSNTGSSSIHSSLGSRIYGYGIIDSQGNWIFKPSEDINDKQRWRSASYSAGINGYIVYLQSGKCGYTDRNGNWILDPLYTDCYDFTNDLAVVVQEDRKTAIIKTNGEIHSQLNYVDVDLSAEGIGTIRSGNECYAFDMKSMDLSIGPFEYLSAYESERFIALKDNMFLLIDLKGNQYGNSFPKMDQLSEDHVAAGTKDGGIFDDYQYGYLDLNGNWVINPQYYEVGAFSEGLAKVSLINE